MKKNKILIILGVLLIASGMVLYISTKHNEVTQEFHEEELKTSDAEAIIKEKISKIIKVYESPKEIFEIEENENDEESEYYTVLNYDTIIDSLFTPEGKKELENTKFNNKNFVVKTESSISILKSIPQANQFKDGNCYTENIKIDEDTITSDVTIYSNYLVEDRLSYYLNVKSIKLIKNNNDWLIDTFIYNNN